MRLALFFSFATVATAARKNIRKLEPEEVGLLHNDVFEQLTKKYTESESILTELDLMMDISDIMAGYCDEDDAECKNLAYEATLKEFHNGDRKVEDIQYPEDFHEDMKTSLENAFDLIKNIKYDNLDDVVDALNEIKSEMQSYEDVNVLQKTVSLSTVSVAIESTKLWHKVFFQADDHPLTRLRLEGNRRLQSSEPGRFYKIITNDVQATIVNGINMLGAVGVTEPDVIVAFIPIVIISILYFGAASSFRTLFGLFL